MTHDDTTDKESVGMDVEQNKTVSLREYADLERKCEQLMDRVERVELSRDAAHRRIDDLEDRIEGNNPVGDDDESGSNDDDLLPIERISRLKEQDEDHPAIPTNGRESLDRAMSIHDNFGSWSEKTPKGRVIKSEIKKLIETATGENLAWSQVYRAMDMLEEWSDGKISHEEHSRFGHILVGDEQALLAGGG